MTMFRRLAPMSVPFFSLSAGLISDYQRKQAHDVDERLKLTFESRDILISREHEVFASFVNSQDYGGGKYAARSTYLSRQIFIHSCHYAQVDHSTATMIFLTFARYQNAASCIVVSFFVNDDPVEYERRFLCEAENLEVDGDRIKLTNFSIRKIIPVPCHDISRHSWT